MKLKSSFKKLDRRVFNITLAEILNLLCILLLMVGMGSLFTSLSGDLQDLTPQVKKVKELSKKNNKMNSNIETTMDKGILIMKTFFLKLITGVIALIALLITITTLTRGFIYSIYSGSNPGTFIRRFAKINIPWQFAWIALIFLTFTMLKKTVAPFLVLCELALYLVLTPVYRSAFTKSHTPKSFLLHLKKFHLYLLPILIIGFLGFINALIWLMIFIKPGLIFIILNSAFTLFLFIWGRTYILEIAGDIK